MRKENLGDYITFSAGANQTRLSENITDDKIYTLEDFDNDLMFPKECYTEYNTPSNKNIVLTTGDVVFSNTRNQVGIVSSENAGKYLNSNFVKCEFDSSKIYSWYFCYLFNESILLKQQIQKIQQGTIGCINRLTINMLCSLEVKFPNYLQQKKIGDLYRNLLIQEYLTLKQIKDVKKFTLDVLEKINND